MKTVKRKRKRYYKQGKFIKIFIKNTCNITATCKALKMDRRTYYDWIEKHPDFAADVDVAREGLIDNAENQLHKNIMGGKEASLIFYLKTKGRKRGYIERKDVNLSGKTEVHYYAPKKDEDK